MEHSSRAREKVLLICMVYELIHDTDFFGCKQPMSSWIFSSNNECFGSRYGSSQDPGKANNQV